jgi:hypothetical protein
MGPEPRQGHRQIGKLRHGKRQKMLKKDAFVVRANSFSRYIVPALFIPIELMLAKLIIDGQYYSIPVILIPLFISIFVSTTRIESRESNIFLKRFVFVQWKIAIDDVLIELEQRAGWPHIVFIRKNVRRGVPIGYFNIDDLNDLIDRIEKSRNARELNTKTRDTY